MIGRTVSHYKITAKLGEGGMGEVYRAHDTKLGRDVALKVLPPVFAQDSQRMARFEREAHVLASLNHPHIAQIHGIEDTNGTKCLVLELVEGETLAERIARGPIPVDEARKIALQIAEGLEAAHEKGIIHRDLKPANIKITPKEKVKILDFGLAKALEEEITASDLSHSPTLTHEATRAGVILGTAAYMSPEQARGKPVDKRTDIWAFGCVLYEMLTGKKAFGRAATDETVSDLIAAVLTSEPDWESLPAERPQGVDRLLRRSLKKPVEERLRDIGDARIEIAECAEELPKSLPRSDKSLFRRWLPALGVLFIGVILATTASWYLAEDPAGPVVRSTIKLPDGYWLDGGRWGWYLPTRRGLTISRDGRSIIFSAVGKEPDPDAQPLLYRRLLDSDTAEAIEGTEGGVDPFLSPDGRWLGFHVLGELRKIPIEGGTVTTIFAGDSARVSARDPAVRTFGASWGPEGKIVFSSDLGTGLSLIPSAGGEVESLTTPDPKRLEGSHRLPAWLPHGKGILFTIFRHGSDRRPRVAVLNTETRAWKEILENAADASYVSSGHLVFARAGTLMAVPFNLERMTVSGEPVPIVRNVGQATGALGGYRNSGAAQYSVSETGTLVYARKPILGTYKDSLAWVDQKGVPTTVSSLPQGGLSSPRLSPDAQRVSYVQHGEGTGIFILDIDRDAITHVTVPGEGLAASLIWSPDGSSLTYSWDGAGTFDVVSSQIDRAGSSPKSLLSPQRPLYPSSWSPNGQVLALVEHKADGDCDILHHSNGELEPLIATEYWEGYPEFSPDGKWLAYVSKESGQFEVYVASYPGLTGRTQVSREGGRSPLWSRDGRQLYYRNWGKPWLGIEASSQVWVVNLKAGDEIVPQKPRLLFDEAMYDSNSPVRGYDLSSDGQSFLMVKLQIQASDLPPITDFRLVQNWTEELKRLVHTE